MVWGSAITSASARFTRATSATCCSTVRKRWTMPMPPARAIAIAMGASVTVSMFAETIGTASRRRRREPGRDVHVGPRSDAAATRREQDVVVRQGERDAGRVHPARIAHHRPRADAARAVKYHRPMAPRLSVVLAVGAVACASLAGCRDSEPVAAPATPLRLHRGGRGAARSARRGSRRSSREATDDEPGPRRAATRLRDLVARARERLAEFRALRLDDPALRRQRDRLAGAYARLIPRMQTAADALGSGDRAPVCRRPSGPSSTPCETLPSAAAS